MAFKYKGTTAQYETKYYFFKKSAGYPQDVQEWLYVTTDDNHAVDTSGYITATDLINNLNVGDKVEVRTCSSISDTATIQADLANQTAVSIHYVASNDGTTVDLTSAWVSATISDVD